MRRFQSYIELFYVIWERACFSFDAGMLSEALFEGWNAWFVSVSERDAVFRVAHGSRLTRLEP